MKYTPEFPIGCTSVVFPGTVMSSKTLILADLQGRCGICVGTVQLYYSPTASFPDSIPCIFFESGNEAKKRYNIIHVQKM